jgi:hypothetical protein
MQDDSTLLEGYGPSRRSSSGASHAQENNLLGADRSGAHCRLRRVLVANIATAAHNRARHGNLSVADHRPTDGYDQPAYRHQRCAHWGAAYGDQCSADHRAGHSDQRPTDANQGAGHSDQHTALTN